MELREKWGTELDARAVQSLKKAQDAWGAKGLKAFVENPLWQAEFADILSPATLPLSHRQVGDELHLVRLCVIVTVPHPVYVRIWYVYVSFVFLFSLSSERAS